MVFKIVCSWCGRLMGEKYAEGAVNQAGQITHGICPHCAGQVRQEILAHSRPKIKEEPETA